MQLSELLAISQDREVSTDFRSKLMTRLLQEERGNAVIHVMVGMQMGWTMGVASAVQRSAQPRPAYSYADYANRSKPLRVVCYDMNRSEYVDANT